jgi:hypothetical protein
MVAEGKVVEPSGCGPELSGCESRQSPQFRDTLRHAPREAVVEAVAADEVDLPAAVLRGIPSLARQLYPQSKPDLYRLQQRDGGDEGVSKDVEGERGAGMRRLLVLALTLILAGCATSQENKVEISIRNTTMEPLVIRVGSGIFTTSIMIPPGGRWSGWVDRRLIGSSGWATIEPAIHAK